MSPSSDWVPSTSSSAIEAVRDGHRVTVIEALGFEPEALVCIASDDPRLKEK